MERIEQNSRLDRKGLLGFLGLGRNEDVADSDLAALAAQLRASAPGSRMEVLVNIAEFLERHDLEINTITLTAANNYVTKSDPLLVRMINGRLDRDEPITMEWLERISGEAADEEVSTADIHESYEKLEKQLVDFSASATAARKATSEYGRSLEGHAEQLGGNTSIEASVEQVLTTVKSMIDRTAQMEKAMSRSEKQSKAMQKNLEAALRLAEEDILTGLPNRRAFERTYKTQFEGAREAVDPLFVAFCDIDHFKRVNDIHGHDTGDRVLKLVANELSQMSNEQCFTARHGGEEFVVLFRGTTIVDAVEKLDAAREKLSQRRLIDRETDKPIGYVTFSAGVADVFSYPDRGAALKAADMALYSAKEKGRNQIITAEPSTLTNDAA